MMMTYEDTRYISLNSQHGISRPSNGTYVKSYLSHIDFNFPGLLNEDTNILWNHVSIIDTQFPVSFYNINYASNTLKYTINGGAIQTLVIPVGNYNISTLKSEIKAQFLVVGYVFTISFNESTNKYTFTNSLYDFSFLSLGSTILETIGFDSVNSYVSTNKVLISEHCVSLLGIKKLKISSVSLGTSATSSLGGSSLLCCVPVSSGPRQMISFLNTGHYKSLLKNKVVNGIDLMITDENNNFINFNNTEYSLTLCIISTRIYNNSFKSLASLFSNVVSKDRETLPNSDTSTNEKPVEVPFDSETDLDFFMFKHGFNTG